MLNGANGNIDWSKGFQTKCSEKLTAFDFFFHSLLSSSPSLDFLGDVVVLIGILLVSFHVVPVDERFYSLL